MNIKFKINSIEDEIITVYPNNDDNNLIRTKPNNNVIDNNIKQYTIIKKFKKIKKNIDLVFSEYIDQCKYNCNKNHLKFIIIFMFLFRELINKLKNNNFTSKKRPGKILELSNEFFPFINQIDFLDSFNDEIRIFFVENLIHLSYWLLRNYYTSAIISLNFLDNNFEDPKI